MKKSENEGANSSLDLLSKAQDPVSERVKPRVDDLIPETVSQLEGAVAIALVQRKEFIECDPAVIDCILRSDSWKKEGYIIYKNMRVYGLGMREASYRREKMTAEDVIFANSKGPGPESPFGSAIAPKIEGIDT